MLVVLTNLRGRSWDT